MLDRLPSTRGEWTELSRQGLAKRPPLPTLGSRSNPVRVDARTGSRLSPSRRVSTG